MLQRKVVHRFSPAQASASKRHPAAPSVLGAVTAFLVCMLGANLTMVYALVTHDFSVHYVSQVGSRATPLVYTVVSAQQAGWASARTSCSSPTLR